MRDVQLRQTIQERAVEIISAFVRLKAYGKNQVGTCPFHADTRPSLSVSPEKGLFHCFGCGAGGDSLTFLMRRKGLTFPEALDEATRLPMSCVFSIQRSVESARIEKYRFHRLLASARYLYLS